jgi:hypothetical protein
MVEDAGDGLLSKANLQKQFGKKLGGVLFSAVFILVIYNYGSPLLHSIKDFFVPNHAAETSTFTVTSTGQKGAITTGSVSGQSSVTQYNVSNDVGCAFDSSAMDKKLDDVQTYLKQSVEQCQKSLPTPPISVQNLASLSDDELRIDIEALSKKLREFGETYKQNFNRILFADAPPSPTREQRHAQFMEQTRQLLSFQADQQSKLNAGLRRDALALREEILGCLNIKKPYPIEYQNDLLDTGIIAGVNPLDDAADTLEDMVRQLP